MLEGMSGCGRCLLWHAIYIRLSYATGRAFSVAIRQIDRALLSLDRHRRFVGGAAAPNIRATRPGRARITRLSISGSTSTTVLQMSRDLLCRIGAALYGEHWHSSLAHDLGVPRRTLQRWATGDARLPPTLRRDLARLVAARQDVLGKLYRELASS